MILVSICTVCTDFQFDWRKKGCLNNVQTAEGLVLYSWVLTMKGNGCLMSRYDNITKQSAFKIQHYFHFSKHRCHRSDIGLHFLLFVAFWLSQRQNVIKGALRDGQHIKHYIQWSLRWLVNVLSKIVSITVTVIFNFHCAYCIGLAYVSNGK